MTATATRRSRKTTEQRAAEAREALQRAEQSQSWANYPAIFEGFSAMGIPMDQIEPRVNVLTYAAWRAKGRQVRKGEHGVKVITWIPISAKERDEQGNETGAKVEFKRPKTTTVFHVSQTDPIQ